MALGEAITDQHRDGKSEQEEGGDEELEVAKEER